MDFNTKHIMDEHMNTYVTGPILESFEEFIKRNKYNRSYIFYEISGLRPFSPLLYKNGYILEILGVTDPEEQKTVASIIVERIVELTLIEHNIISFIRHPRGFINSIIGYLEDSGSIYTSKEVTPDDDQFMLKYIEAFVLMLFRIIGNDIDKYHNVIDNDVVFTTKLDYYYISRIDSDLHTDYPCLVIRRFQREEVKNG